ncbi:MAG: FkbM family methyltransferase [Candidatus Lokiarchaeota archaeon]|nr:FkbM family methyltransferase [Candidatus Lokiarchaeota archaeon]
MRHATLPNGLRVACIDKLTARYVYDEIFVDGVYTRQGGIGIRPGDVVFDVGANIGLFTLFAAAQASEVEIHAFEPVPRIFEALRANTAALGPRVHLYNVGLGDAAGDVDFQFYPRVCADSTATPFDFEAKVARYVETYDESIAKDMPVARIIPRAWRPRVVRSFLKQMYTGQAVTCRVRPLSDIIAEQRVARIDLLKVDAENAERGVVAGMTEEAWDKVRQVSMEVHTHIAGGEGLVSEMQGVLESRGFRVSRGAESRETIMGVFMVYGKK